MPSDTPSTSRAKTLENNILATRKMTPGGENYRAYVGPPQQYDFMGATQFRLATALGLREEDHVVDIGCGSLRAGRLLLQYLLPGQYTGIEPHEWLWKTAIAEEIGQDVVDLKAPRFFAEDDFTMSGVEDGGSAFIIAQSIYSHVGSDLLQTSMAAVARCLSEQGQFLFTAILPDCPHAGNMPRASSYSGWLYPGCTVFEEAEIQQACRGAGLHVQRLPWYHPRQVWFRAVASPDRLMTPEMISELGSGRPLFDRRFEPPTLKRDPNESPRT